jgi:hypothetical protein
MLIRLDVDPQELGGLDIEPALLAKLAAQRVERVLRLVDEATGQVPVALARLECTPREQHPTVTLEDPLHAGHRICPVPLTAGAAYEMVFRTREFSAAAGTEPPVVQNTHEEDMMENPEPTEDEQELSNTERQQEEEDMRGTTDPDDDNLPTEDDVDA